jgi:nitroreductase
MNELDFIYKRRSVRKFQDKPVLMEHLRAIIKAATYAPSGKNMQNWHFVILKNREKIVQLAEIVEQRNASIAKYLVDEAKIKAFKSMLPYQTVFKNAPVVILVYAGRYPTIADNLLEAQVMPQEEVLPYFRPNPGIQNIGAAMENLLLSAAALGYGTCWMTGPTYADKEMSEFVGFSKEGYYLAAMTPLGIPADQGAAQTGRIPIDDVMTIIE